MLERQREWFLNYSVLYCAFFLTFINKNIFLVVFISFKADETHAVNTLTGQVPPSQSCRWLQNLSASV